MSVISSDPPCKNVNFDHFQMYSFSRKKLVPKVAKPELKIIFFQIKHVNISFRLDQTKKKGNVVNKLDLASLLVGSLEITPTDFYAFF